MMMPPQQQMMRPQSRMGSGMDKLRKMLGVPPGRPIPPDRMRDAMSGHFGPEAQVMARENKAGVPGMNSAAPMRQDGMQQGGMSSAGVTKPSGAGAMARSMPTQMSQADMNNLRKDNSSREPNDAHSGQLPPVKPPMQVKLGAGSIFKPSRPAGEIAPDGQRGMDDDEDEEDTMPSMAPKRMFMGRK